MKTFILLIAFYHAMQCLVLLALALLLPSPTGRVIDLLFALEKALIAAACCLAVALT